jgi:hypothetical protein
MCLYLLNNINFQAFPDNVINFHEGSYLIEDFAEKFDTDFYPENSILVLENIFFIPEETGFIKEEDGKIIKLDYEEKLPYIKIL